MFMVYWTLVNKEEKTPCSKEFDSAQMTEAMKFAESLRAEQREGKPIRFITLCSENPNAVGEAGVADAKPDYNWKKRRR